MGKLKTKTSLPAGLDRGGALRMYEKMLVVRQFELAAQERGRDGEIASFLHLYLGEEATAVGVCAGLRATDWITSTHRGHGHALAKGMPPRVLMAELYAKATGCCAGRGGSMHLYDPGIGLFGTNGIVGGGTPSAVGAALSAKVRRSGQVAVAFFGDGGTNNGSFHESMNFAGIQKAPVVFVCENNLYSVDTALGLSTLNTDIASKAAAHGIPGVTVDGNDVLAVWKATKRAVERARSGRGPTLIEARTYRTVAHNEGGPVAGAYRTQKEIDRWKKSDPILRFRRRLIVEFKAATAAELDAIERRVRAEIDEAVEFARSSPRPDPSSAFLQTWHDPINPPLPAAGTPAKPAVQGWLDAVRDGIAEEMRRDPHMLYVGEGVGESNGTFAHTRNLWKEFGGGRVIDTPISELAFTGAALGASATGCRTIADLMFIEFLFEAAGQVVLQAAKLRYMSNGQMSAPVVIRAPAGSIPNAGPHHAGSYHPMWAHVPGLIVVMPSNPADAKGLMKTALRAHDPVIFVEPKALYSTKGEVPSGEHFVPFGQARVVREGRQLTIVACGQLVRTSLEAAEALEREGVSCEVIDLRTIVPMDVDTIAASVAKTGHLLVVDEGYAMCGIGGEIGQAMMELAFDKLEAPVGRLHTDPASHPVDPKMLEAILVTVDKVVAAGRQVIAGRAPIPRRATGSGAQPMRAASVADRAPAALEPKPQPEARAVATAQGEPVARPHGDLTVTEATVVKWHKRVGEAVAKGEILADVETDKAVSGIESPIDGVLAEVLEPEGSVVKMGQVLAVVRPP